MIPCHVISIKDDFPNRKSLERVGLNPTLFKGINAKKDEHLEHSEQIHVSCRYTCPKSTIGCGLSHILLSEKLYNEKVPVALILEDDAYPKVSKIDFEQIISSVPEDWEIIKLHADIYCREGSHEHDVTCGSAAAYLINRKGMKKVKDMKLLYHFDVQLSMSDLKLYKTKYNFFETDEFSSDNRQGTEKHWFSFFLPKFTSGTKSTHHIFLYKIIRIPGTSIEITLGQFVNVFCMFLIFFVVYKEFSSRN